MMCTEREREADRQIDKDRDTRKTVGELETNRQRETD